ncbi:ABC transporter permease [Staphylococcus aureus]|nr:ABC transporter permease [Staphylococcus aureus]
MTSMFPLRTLLKDADRLFLLPFEKNMEIYMAQSLVYSYFSRIGLQLLILIVLFPLFFVINNRSFEFYILFAVLMLVMPYL